RSSRFERCGGDDSKDYLDDQHHKHEKPKRSLDCFDCARTAAAHPRNLGVVDERMLSKYATDLRSAGHKAATIQGHLAYLRAALRWAADQKMIPHAPKVTMPKVPKKATIRKISAEEFERLHAAAPDPLWAAFVATAWYTG